MLLERSPVVGWVFAVVTALLVGSCATIGGANYYSEEQEWELGRKLEPQLASDLNLVNDATLNRYVTRMGNRMLQGRQMGRRPWRFHVVADDDINAFNVPGGLIYVNTGLIAKAGSAAELAGAIAHEVGHGVARHGTQRLSKAQEANILAGVVLGGDPGLVEQLAAQIVAQGTFASFSRSDEREADRLGVRLMANAGYDPEGLARLLERLSEQEQSGGGGLTLFRSHPMSAERVRNVRSYARSINQRGLRMNDGEFSSIRSRAARY